MPEQSIFNSRLIMYIISLISAVVLIASWLQLRRISKIWMQRAVSTDESITAGIAAWFFFFSLLAWFLGIYLLFIQVLTEKDITDIFILTFLVLLSAYIFYFYMQSRYELRYDETMDFWKEALQFRRSEQRRLDILDLMQKERERKQKGKKPRKDALLKERIQLQANLDKEKEQNAQLDLLRKGVGINIIEMWQMHGHTSQPLFEKIKEARIDPDKKRLVLHADFSELKEENLKDDTAVLRLNRQIYDFFQILNAEPWLKPYSPYYETYFLICRTMKRIQDGSEILYPFMKIEAKISELRKLEGTYFNPRRLAEITELDFNGGSQVRTGIQ